MPAKDFKACLAGDIGSVFLSPAEFASLHNIDGRQVPAMLDENELLERDKGKMGLVADGTYISRRLLYVAAADFGARPALRRQLILDGKRYQVAGCLEEGGIYSIELEAVRT